MKELGAAVDLPPDAPKYRVWLRIPVPPHEDGRGRLGLLGVRVMGGPWAVWADGQLQQANLSDWRIQWNVPLRSAVPLGAREVLGVVWDCPAAPPEGLAPAQTKDVAGVLDGLPPLNDRWRQLVQFAARYYQRSLGEVALSVLPPEVEQQSNAPDHSRSSQRDSREHSAARSHPERGRSRL